MEDIVDLLNVVNQQLVESGGTIDVDQDDHDRKGPAHSSPAHPAETSTTVSHLKFSTPSPNKSIVSPSKRHLVCVCQCFFVCLSVFYSSKTLRWEIRTYIFIFLCIFLQISPKTPHWVEDQKSLLQMLCQQVEALKVRIRDYVIIQV